MCYPKPGPRCSAHAEARLIALNAKLQGAPSDQEDYDKFFAARDEFLMSPKGLQTLERRTQRYDISSSQRAEARQQYSLYSQMRKDRLDLLKTDYNQTDEGSYFEHQDSVINPTEEALGNAQLRKAERRYASTERAFSDIKSIDPEGCGCTDCLVGEAENEGSFTSFASLSDMIALRNGDIKLRSEGTVSGTLYEAGISHFLDNEDDDEELDNMHAVFFPVKKLDDSQGHYLESLSGREGSQIESGQGYLKIVSIPDAYGSTITRKLSLTNEDKKFLSEELTKDDPNRYGNIVLEDSKDPLTRLTISKHSSGIKGEKVEIAIYASDDSEFSAETRLEVSRRSLQQLLLK